MLLEPEFLIAYTRENFSASPSVTVLLIRSYHVLLRLDKDSEDDQTQIENEPDPSLSSSLQYVNKIKQEAPFRPLSLNYVGTCL